MKIRKQFVVPLDEYQRIVNEAMAATGGRTGYGVKMLVQGEPCDIYIRSGGEGRGGYDVCRGDTPIVPETLT